MMGFVVFMVVWCAAGMLFGWWGAAIVGVGMLAYRLGRGYVRGGDRAR